MMAAFSPGRIRARGSTSSAAPVDAEEGFHRVTFIDVDEDEVEPAPPSLSRVELEQMLAAGPSDAAVLNQLQMRSALKERELEPSGFLSDDVKALQLIYNTEFQRDVDAHKADLARWDREAKRWAQSSAAREELARQAAQEKAALVGNAHLAHWLRLFRAGVVQGAGSAVGADGSDRGTVLLTETDATIVDPAEVDNEERPDIGDA